jgi:tetratricopeptide (TPR) repeat protein
MKECEEEFDYQSEQKRARPKIVVPLPQTDELRQLDLQRPAFLAGFVVDKATRQAVNVKLDSILIKGSKILAKSAKSDYVIPSLFLMAKTYFYQEEWMPSQIKCSELIDKDPAGKYSADAHLLMAMNLLMQGKNEAALTILSRTVDVAWLNERYDILTSAFNIEAEMALFEGDLEGAIRPYFQAIAQSNDNSAKALWQNDMAIILFKMGKFERAEKAFAKVMNFSPDLVTEYESKLYLASCQIRQNKFEEADKILYRLDNDGKYEEWKDYVVTQKMIKNLGNDNKETVKMTEFWGDSLFPTSQAKASYYFERGLQDFYAGDYISARSAMAKARQSVPEIARPATKIFNFLNYWETSHKNIKTYLTGIEQTEELNKALQEKGIDPNNIDNSGENNSEKVANTDEKVEENIAENDTISDNNPEENITENKVEENENPDAENENSKQIQNVDSLKLFAANNYFELARHHFNIGNKDSANYYYQVAAEISPLNLEGSSRYLYVYSESVRDTNAWKADSLLDIIVNTQPKTIYGKEALARLGYTAAFINDTVLALYNSGYDLMKAREYDYARQQFAKVYNEYPQNETLAPKALYALGNMYERSLQNFDTAKYYYSILLEDYPNSIYAKELMLPVRYKDLIDNKDEIPDSLKSKEIEIYQANIRDIIDAPYDTTLLAKPKKDGFSFDDLKNPSKLLKKAKEGIKGAINKGSDAISDPEVLLQKAKENLTPEIKVPKIEDFMPKEETENPEGTINPEINPEGTENIEKPDEKPENKDKY